MKFLFGFLVFIVLLICTLDAMAETVIIKNPNKTKIVKMCYKGKIVYAMCPDIVDQKCVASKDFIMTTDEPCK